MKRELRDLVDLVAALEEPAGGLVAEIMEVQILDPQDVARAGERRTDALGSYGKMYSTVRGVGLHDRPGPRGVLEAAVIAFLGRGCLASRTMPVRPISSLSDHSRRLISASRRAEVMAKSMTASMGICARLVTRAK